MLITSKLNIKISDLKIDGEGRYIVFKGEIQGAKIVFGNFYFPTRDKENKQIEFLSNIDKVISEILAPEYTIQILLPNSCHSN